MTNLYLGLRLTRNKQETILVQVKIIINRLFGKDNSGDAAAMM